MKEMIIEMKGNPNTTYVFTDEEIDNEGYDNDTACLQVILKNGDEYNFPRENILCVSHVESDEDGDGSN